MASKKLTPEQQALFDALTVLQKKFVTQIISGKNQSDAYRAAGGKAKTPEAARASASEILTNPNVAAFMESIEGAAIDEAIMTREEALRRLTSMGRAKITDLVEFSERYMGLDENGNEVIQAVWRFKDSVNQNPELLDSIAEITAGKEGIKLKLHDSRGAIKQMADMEGWQAPSRHEHTGKDGGPIESATLTKDEYKAARREMLEDDDC